VADHVAADLNAAMVAVGRLEVAVVFGGGVVEIAPDLVVQTGLVVLEREQVVTATIQDGLGNPGLRSHGIDGDECAGQCQALQKERNGRDLIGLGLTCLLPEHQALAAGPCRDQVQRPTVLAAVVSAPRGLAVDGDDLRRGGGRSGLAQVFDPGGEALCEQRAVDGVDVCRPQTSFQLCRPQTSFQRP